MPKTIEYRIIPIPLFSLLRYTKEEGVNGESGGTETLGDFHSRDQAELVARLIADADAARSAPPEKI